MCRQRWKFDMRLFSFAFVTLFVYAHVVSNYKCRISQTSFFFWLTIFFLLSSTVCVFFFLGAKYTELVWWLLLLVFRLKFRFCICLKTCCRKFSAIIFLRTVYFHWVCVWHYNSVTISPHDARRSVVV